jgi:hypothetical protein
VKVQVARLRREAQRAKTRARREAEYEKWKADNAERLAAEAAERETREAALAAARAAKQDKWAFVLPYLQGDGAFVSNMRDMIERGEPPAGRALAIVGEIYAKAHGRRGSRAYDDALDEFEARIG